MNVRPEAPLAPRMRMCCGSLVPVDIEAASCNAVLVEIGDVCLFG